jgi:hypothetical protein
MYGLMIDPNIMDMLCIERNRKGFCPASSGGSGSNKLVCIDLKPDVTTQAPDRSDILNVGGFSDAVFRVVASFLGDDANRFVGDIEAVELQHYRGRAWVWPLF